MEISEFLIIYNIFLNFICCPLINEKVFNFFVHSEFFFLTVRCVNQLPKFSSVYHSERVAEVQILFHFDIPILY